MSRPMLSARNREAIVFDNTEIEIPCSGCGQKTAKTVGWLKANGQFVCSGCGATINVDSEQLIAGLDKVDDVVAKLRASLSKLGKG
jgi:transcription elongation factor Elf1